MRKLNEIIVHCTATPEGRHVTVDEVRAWHLARGWKDIGYHFIVYLDGSVHTGRPLSQIGSHVGGRNTGTIGVAYVGGVSRGGNTPKDTRTPEQKTALRSLLVSLLSQYPSIKLISGHHDYAAKACPSFPARAEYASLTNGGPLKEEPITALDFSNDRYRYLQSLLTRMGVDPGLHDGIPGPKTTSAIKTFQRRYDLPRSGIFDTPTVGKLRSLAE